MTMSTICATVGQAPAAVHGGFVTFDYDQTNHPNFGPFGAVPPGAPNGLCLALTMAWLKNWKDVRQGYRQYVEQGPGLLNVQGHMVGIFAGPGGAPGWPAQTIQYMTAVGAGYGFAAVGGGLAAGPAWIGIALGIQNLAGAARFTILIGRTNAGAHAIGILRSNQTVYFFDCNQGEVYFRTAAGFGAWFMGYVPVGFGVAAPRFWNLKFN